MIKIIPHGPLRAYPSFEVDADSAAEAIEAWSNQTELKLVPMHEKPVIEVIGFETIEKLEQPTKVKELHLIPRMAGGNGTFGKILLGAAFIGLSFIPGLGQIGQLAISSALFMTGVGLMIGGIMQIFMKTPKVQNSDDPEASRYLGSSVNTTAIGTPIPRGYGRLKIGGQFLSVQVNAQDMVYGQFPETPDP